jgi:hypothetical protein
VLESDCCAGIAYFNKVKLVAVVDHAGLRGDAVPRRGGGGGGWRRAWGRFAD